MSSYRVTGSMRALVPLLRTFCGWICLTAGIVGLVLPVLPGVPLLLAGLILLSSNYRWARQCVHWLKERSRKLAGRKRGSPDMISYPK